MEKVYLKQNPEIKDDISKLYISAFPEDERPHLNWFYKMIAFKKKNQVIGYYENNEFIGFVYLVFYKKIVYTAFFAVIESKRNQGYGTRILNDIRHTFVIQYTIYRNVKWVVGVDSDVCQTRLHL